MNVQFNNPELQKEWDSIPENMKTSIIDVFRDQIYTQLIKNYANEMRNGLRQGLKEEDIKHEISYEEINKFRTNENIVQLNTKKAIEFSERWLHAGKNKRNKMLLKEGTESILRDFKNDNIFLNDHWPFILQQMKLSKDFLRENLDKINKKEIQHYNDYLDLFKEMEADKCLENTNIQLRDPNDTLFFSSIFIMYFFRMWEITENIENEKIIKKVQDFVYNYYAWSFINLEYNMKNIITNNKEYDLSNLYENIKQKIKKIEQNFKCVVDNSLNKGISRKYKEIYEEINLYLAYNYKDTFECLKNIECSFCSDFLT